MRPATDLVVSFAPPDIGDAEMRAVLEVLQSGWLTTGPKVKAFEAAVAAYTGAQHAVAVNSGTAALHLSLLAAGIEAGREVITTPLHLLRDDQRDHPRRRHAGAGRHRSRHAEPRSGRGRRRGDAARRRRSCRCTSPDGRRRWPASARIAARHGLTIVDDAAHAFGAAAGRAAHRRRRRSHRLQLPRREEHHDRRGRHGHDRSRRLGRAHPRDGAARHEPRRVGALRRPRRGAVRSRRGRLQVQHDGPAGGDRPAAAGPRRRHAGASPARCGSATTRASPICR